MRSSLKQDLSYSHLHQFRLSVLVALLISLSMLLILRLAYLQFSQYQHYATLAFKNQMSIISIAPPRGIIYDRNGVVLAENRPVYVLEIIPERVKDLQNTIKRLQDILPSITEEDISHFEKTRRQNRSYTSIPLKLKLSQEDVAIFSSKQYQFPGVTIKASLMRHYPLAETTAHLLGYVGRINQDELQRVDSTNYRSTHFIGKSGVEKYYESLLHGQVGYQQIETDVSGRTLRVLNRQPPISGHKLYLTIDAHLQQVAHDALQDKAGAVVMINTKNGEILVMSSAPSFDPNLFVNGISNADYKELSNVVTRPLYNRAVRGLYPPASTIKPFIAIAGLNQGAITINSHIYDPGWYKLPGISHSYRDWKRKGHGVINIKRAITVSCDTFFYQLGNKIGISAIEDMLMQFGFGQAAHVDLHEEASGLLPSPHWKKQNKKLPWYPGDTLITSIGQGFMLATPLQMANATASLSQHGQRFRPHLLNYVVDEQQQRYALKAVEEYPLRLKDSETWNIVTDAMRSVITSNEGTGYRFGRNAPYSVAGKTGTAQVFSLSQDDKKQYTNLPTTLRDHSLFIGFAPVENPEVAIAVLVENDTVAPFVARQVMDAYFEQNKEPQP